MTSRGADLQYPADLLGVGRVRVAGNIPATGGGVLGCQDVQSSHVTDVHYGGVAACLSLQPFLHGTKAQRLQDRREWRPRAATRK